MIILMDGLWELYVLLVVEYWMGYGKWERGIFHVVILRKSKTTTESLTDSLTGVKCRAYILKADVLDVWTPQKIQIFRRKIV